MYLHTMLITWERKLVITATGRNYNPSLASENNVTIGTTDDPGQQISGYTFNDLSIIMLCV